MITASPTFEKYEEFVNKKVKAIISVSSPHKLHNRKALREALRKKVGRIPSINVLFKDGLEMVKKKASKVKIFIKQDEKEAFSQNVVAEVKGTKIPEEIIAVVAHYDGISKSLAGHDNASGSAIITELARCILQQPLQRTVRFIQCGGEEFGLCGSQSYVKKHKNELENFLLCINVDIAGPILGQNCCFVTGPETLQHYLECMGKEEGMGFKVSTEIYSSDSVSFSQHGIPSTSITRGGGYVYEVHSSRDGLEDIDAEHLAITGKFILKFLRRIGNAVEFPFKREIPEKPKKDVEEYLDKMHGKHFKPKKKKPR